MVRHLSSVIGAEIWYTYPFHAIVNTLKVKSQATYSEALLVGVFG